MSPDGPCGEACFVSYSRSDGAFAMRFAADLRSGGVETWLDQLDIRPSEHWDIAIERAIANCRCVVALLSPRSVVSENVADEISLSINLGKPVFPVMIEPCKLPLRLTRMHVIDAAGGYESAVAQCLAEIRSLIAGPGGMGGVGAGANAVRDPASLALAKRHLACVMGPIADILVDRAAARATSIENLYGLLSRYIRDEEGRLEFASLMPRFGGGGDPASAAATGLAQSAGSLSPGEIDRMAKALARFLGPIAAIIVKQESAAASTANELRGRLARLLTSADEQDQLLADLAAVTD